VDQCNFREGSQFFTGKVRTNNVTTFRSRQSHQPGRRAPAQPEQGQLRGANEQPPMHHMPHLDRARSTAAGMLLCRFTNTAAGAWQVHLEMAAGMGKSEGCLKDSSFLTHFSILVILIKNIF
jgi:hypothetical protein